MTDGSKILKFTIPLMKVIIACAADPTMISGYLALNNEVFDAIKNLASDKDNKDSFKQLEERINQKLAQTENNILEKFQQQILLNHSSDLSLLFQDNGLELLCRRFQKRNKQQIDNELKNLIESLQESVLSHHDAIKSIARNMDYLRHLSPKTLNWHDKDNEAGALRAEYRLVPVQGRDLLPSEIDQWLNQEDDFLGRLYHAFGGAGKTRLWIDCCEAARAKGWVAGFLSDNIDETSLHNIVTLSQTAPLLIVFDYGESNPSFLSNVISKCVQYEDDALHPIRLVILARSNEGWLGNISGSGGVGDFIKGDRFDDDCFIPGFPNDESARLSHFNAAVDAYGKVFNKTRPENVQIPDLNQDHFQRTLFIHMAAFAYLDGLQISSKEKLLDHALQHERDIWAKREDPLVFNLCAAALTLFGEISDEQIADDFLSQAGLSNGDSRRNIYKHLQSLYPHKRRSFDGIQPDLIGEHLVARTISPETLKKILQSCSFPTYSKTLQVLVGGAQRGDNDAKVLCDCVGDAFQETTDIDKLRSLVHEFDTTYKVTTVLRKTSVNVTGRYYLILKRLFDQEKKNNDNVSIDVLVEFARVSNNFSVCLSDIGRREEAVSVAQEAVDIYQTLSQAQPDAFLPVYASSLNNYAIRLSAVGRREEAVSVAKQAVDIRHTLSQAQPDAFLADYASSLNNYANRLSAVGRKEEAVSVAQEAVDIYQTLSQAHPDAFLADYAMSLSNYATRLSAVGRREEAVSVAQEAVDIRRTLSQAQPDAFLPDYASSLNNYASFLSAVGRREEAVSVAQETVDIYRTLSQAQPDAFLPDYAMSLNNYANLLSEIGRREEALSVAQEAVDIYRTLSQAQPDAFLPDYASSLNNYANRLSAVGRKEEAVSVAQEAVDIYRTLSQAQPDAFLPNYAASLNTYANHLSDAGRREEAVSVAQEAVDIRRTLSQAQPDAFLADYARSLGALGAIYQADENMSQAYDCFHEGCRVLSPFFIKMPQAFAPLMGGLARDYIQVCETLEKEPDYEMLAPIAEVFEKIQPPTSTA